MLGNCERLNVIRKRLMLELALRYGSYLNWLKYSVLVAKYACGLFLQENGSSGLLEN